MKSVILIDDHPILRLGLRTLLEAEEGYWVAAEAESRRNALSILQRVKADLAILDLMLGQDDGLELIKDLKQLYPYMRILVLTMQNPGTYIQRARRAGADGFLTKQEAQEKLSEALKGISKGQGYFPESMENAEQEELEETSIQGLSELSDRELHVFQMVGFGVSNKDMAKNLSLSPKTIETYKENIKRKLKLASVSELRQLSEDWISKQA